MTAQPLRIVFMGTPDFSVPALQALIDSPHEVIAVYSQPPRPKGRGHQVQKSPVHMLAKQNNIPVLTPKSLRKDADAVAAFAALNADVAAVAAYGLLLPPAVLKAPRFGCLNIHASLLPRWRGASPIQSAILHGDDKSGVAIMQMEEGLDTGPVIAVDEVPITQATTASGLHDELSVMGARLIAEVMDRLAETGARLPAAPQDDEAATYAPLLTKQDGRVDWTQDAAVIDRKIRALTPWPGVWTTTQQDKRIKILEAVMATEKFGKPPGIMVDRAGHVACGADTGLQLLRVQPENAKPMDVVSAVNGGYLKKGQKFH